jgi:hypothetical protein
MDRINRDAQAAQGIIDNSQAIIDLWNTPEAEKEKYKQKIEATMASHQQFITEWRQKATTMLCPNLDDLP